LDSVAKHKREQERSTKLETDSQLNLFRKEQSKVEQQSRQPESRPSEGIAAEWEFAGKKRRKAEDKGGLKGVKLRKTGTSDAKEGAGAESIKNHAKAGEQATNMSGVPLQKLDSGSTELGASKPTSTGLGLAAYSSDED
jgi:hypothetical protein